MKALAKRHVILFMAKRPVRRTAGHRLNGFKRAIHENRNHVERGTIAQVVSIALAASSSIPLRAAPNLYGIGLSHFMNTMSVLSFIYSLAEYRYVFRKRRGDQ
ncbi:hypothetical protein [Effusibacillus dendaii]|uniref:Uncharacterized protein n=1 Tax=Effusibacillus dendaii TaxID=2743772 RepID=A0A7I8D6A8_9BACL|nr:hypothetical protein [Effusibacillus dendaii]BCJ85527.1 hypothetical protein skT53_05120 [Effusibacillus dendaii]